MINKTVNNNTGEPVTEQAPTKAPEATSTVTTATSATTPSTANLPEIADIEKINKIDAAEISKTAFAVTATHAPSPEMAGTGLPSNYAVGGLLDENGVIRHEYLGEYAKELAQKLKPLSATTFQRTFLTKAKEASKKKAPYSAKKNCAMNMVIQAQKLVHRKKEPAPVVLQEMIELATATVTDPATFEALYMHLDAVCIFMLCE